MHAALEMGAMKWAKGLVDHQFENYVRLDGTERNPYPPVPVPQSRVVWQPLKCVSPALPETLLSFRLAR